MSEILDAIKEKYLEEIGISFSFFEALTYIVYLTVSYIVFCEKPEGVWGSVLTKSINDLLFSDNSILVHARIADFFISGILTYATILTHKNISNTVYKYLATLKNMEDYVDNLKQNYRRKNLGGQAMRIYIANSAKEQKEIHLRKVINLKGCGLLAMAIAYSSIIGLSTPNLTDIIFLIGALVIVLIAHWTAFTTYTSQVVPRLVLERLARYENVKFGEALQ